MQGVFDLYRWSIAKFDEAQKIDTESSSCRAEDRKMLVAAIEKHGGFGELDKKCGSSWSGVLTRKPRHQNSREKQQPS